MKYEFVVPEEIGLMGVEISVKSDSSIEVYDDDWGQYLAAQNQILLTERICASALFEAFCHEVSEAIADKFINQGKKNSYDVPHEIIDAYGRGIHNFIVENAHLIISKVANDDQPRRAQEHDGEDKHGVSTVEGSEGLAGGAGQ